MRHKYPNRGGTNRNLELHQQLRPATRISRAHWHSRKRVQMIMVPKKNDWDVIMLQGAAMREVYERPRKPSKIAINSKQWFEKKANRVPVIGSARKRRAKAAQVGK